MKEFSHVPVLLEECMQYLAVHDGGIYFDGTVGGGGHSYQILKRSSPTGRLIATDKDDEALAAAKIKLQPFEGRFHLYKSDFKNFDKVLAEEGVDELDGALLDLGVSSHQLDDSDRGFSYLQQDAPLDMRMDKSQPFTAADILNKYPEREIAKILRNYGEEKFASVIARNIVSEREKKPLETCGELAEIIENSIPKKFSQNGPPSRKSFQALRIAVNGELDGLYDCVLSLTRRLKKGGRIAIISFHSLEDRAVKQAFKMLECDCICDKSLPVCVCGKVKEIEILTNKPVTAGARELTVNPRSKSAKLRIAEKII